MINFNPALVSIVSCAGALFSMILFLLLKNKKDVKEDSSSEEKSKPARSSYEHNVEILYDLEHLNKSESCHKSFLLDKIAEIIFKTRQNSLTKDQKNFADSFVRYLIDPVKPKDFTIAVEGSLDHLHLVCMKALRDSLKAKDLNFETSLTLDSITYTYSSLELPEAIQIRLDDYLVASKDLRDYLEKFKKLIL